MLEAGTSKRRFKVAYQAPILPAKIKGYTVKVLPIPSSLYLTTSADNVQKDRYFFLDLQAMVPKAFRTGRVHIRYPKEKVRLLRTSVNPKFQDQRYFDKLQHKDGLESIDNWDYRWGAFSGSLCKFHFKALKEGPITFELQNDGVTILRKIVQINPRKGDLK